MDIGDRAKYAMKNYMSKNPDKLSTGYRVYFGITPFPCPKAEHIQWDDGDGTARGLDAWLYLRSITGDYETGKEIENGQWEYLCNIINPQMGLAYVADLSFPNKKGYYYHMWDQGRTFRHLINRYVMLAENDKEKRLVEAMIIKMIKSLKNLGTEKKLQNNDPAVYWEYELYFDDMPVIKSEELGYDIKYAFTICNAQLLEPAVKWAEITGCEEDLLWAVQLANGFIAGLEQRRGSTAPMFGENGEFYCHFHCSVSGLVGLVLLARRLILLKKYQMGKVYLDIALKAYEWIFSEENDNRGSSHGWFPESSIKKGQSNISEICCTADMIELAAALASISELMEGYEWLDKYWDDVERFTRNELCQMQILHPDKLERWIDPKCAQSRKDIDSVFEKFNGGWPFGHTWPHDLMDYDKDTVDGSIRIPIGGCCFYSGPRALFACWNNAVEEKEKGIDIRLPIKFENDIISINELPSGGLTYTLKTSKKASKNIFVRIPKNVERKNIKVFRNGEEFHTVYDEKTNRVVLNSEYDVEYKVKWNNPEWESFETLGPANDGHVLNVPVGEKITYKLKYAGNKLKSIFPIKAAYLPYDNGL